MILGHQGRLSQVFLNLVVNAAQAMDEKNLPTALIELSTPGGPLGEWVVSAWAGDAVLADAVRASFARQIGGDMASAIAQKLTMPQTIDVGGNFLQTFGGSTPTPPTVTITSPKAGDNLPIGFPIRADIMDDIGASKAERQVVIAGR